MESLWNAVRSKVSADKNRYLKGNYDLDLTYITDRVIGMSFPAEGVLEATYRNRIDDVAQMLKEAHSDHFMIYNLSERTYDYSKFNNQVHEWCGFPDHHGPPLEKLFQIVRSIHSWLLADKKNVVVVHCLAGKGRTGTVIASYFLWAGLFRTADDALNYFACRRSNNNWGVTGPSQVRYVRYFQDIVLGLAAPSRKPLHLVYLHISSVPSFSNAINPLNRQGGCTPFIHVYQVSEAKKLIYSTEHDNEELKSFVPGQAVTFQIDCTVRGDILIEIYHVTSFYRTEHMLRFQFNTGMVTGSVLRFKRSELDLACQDKRFSPEFFLDLGFEHLTANGEPENKYWEGAPLNDNGTICFFDQTHLAEARKVGQAQRAKVEKGGYLTKRGHQVKNWKRRWFVLKDPTLCYYKSPRDTTPAGIIIVDDIVTIISEKNIYKDIKPADRPPFWFEIVTKKNNYLICADSEQEMRDWVEALEFVGSQRQFELRASSEITNPNVQYSSSPSDFDDDIEYIPREEIKIRVKQAVEHEIIDKETASSLDSITDSVNAIEQNLAALDTDPLNSTFKGRQDNSLSEKDFVTLKGSK